MKCPACYNEMTQKEVSGITVDVCEGGCAGVWFDQLELKKFDEPAERDREELLNINRNPSIIVDTSKKRNCPRCENIKMMQHFFSIKKEVVVDECASCGGFFFDAGELAEIRRLFESEKEKNEAARKSFSEQFDGQISEMVQESKERAESARKIANMFRFICPSYYIPGKQSGAAF